MFFEVLTLFPEMFTGVLGESILKRAVERKLISVNLTDFRRFSNNKHNKVDDSPYGGDPGMVIKPEPLAEAIKDAKQRHSKTNPKVVFLTPHGERLNQTVVNDLAKEDGLILLCGHYKGIDYRIREKYVDLEISLGDFVLSGGEIGAMTIIDSVSRMVPGVLGNKESAGRDSHYNGLLSAPCYTRPEEFEEMCVPPVLLSGNHKKVAEWDKKMSQKITQEKRPDLWQKYLKNKE
jgi:tRNA (guanine37-N1)-methyltransferase